MRHKKMCRKAMKERDEIIAKYGLVDLADDIILRACREAAIAHYEYCTPGRYR